MSYRWGQRSKDRMNGVYPYLIECAELFISKSKYDATIPWLGGLRTVAQQNDCYIRGASKCDGINNFSRHQAEAFNTGYGMALDIIPTGKNPYSDTRKLNYFGRLMMECWQELIYKYAEDDIFIGVMVWGGTFGATSWDRAHYEIHV